MEEKSIKSIKEVVTNLFPIFFQRKNSIGIFSMCAYRINNKYAKNVANKYIVVNDRKFFVNTLFKKGIKLIKIGKYTYFFNIYKVSFDIDFLKTCPLQNLIKITFEYDEEKLEAPVVYNIIHLNKCKGYTSKIYSIKNSDDMVSYFRQGRGNSMSITVRKRNVTDSKKSRIKIFFAWALSKLTPKSKKVLLYEKEINKYEESAATVYEKLIDMGYNNAYFVINKSSSHTQFIKEKYRKNIIWGHSFKHYLEFFRCRKFIGSESMVHVMELRIANKFVTTKLQKKKFKYVFLQHGVMYMVSLDSANRGFFRKGIEMPKDAKIVVSSKLEADHFVDLAGFDYEDLYITGLPFYDRTIKKDSADKITIMPTWRPWDYNTLISDYGHSSYYNMVLNIYNNIPDNLNDRVIILPHPLVMEIFKKTPLGKYIPEVISYDLILEDTALLITDYSSIAYSAFYRGSNVVFVWNELEECMKNYEGHLMLNEANVFGDVIYEYNSVGQVVDNNYMKTQQEKYIKAYERIVEFRDNKNTERLVELLKRDKII